MSDYFINIADYFNNFPNNSNSAQQLFTTQSQKYFFRDLWETELWMISKKSILSSKSDSMLIIDRALSLGWSTQVLGWLLVIFFLEKDRSALQLVCK